MDPETLIFCCGMGDQITAVHQYRTGIFLSIHQICFIRAESFKAYAASGRIGFDLQGHAQQGFTAVFLYKVPAVEDGLFAQVCEAVLEAVLDQVLIFLEF